MYYLVVYIDPKHESVERALIEYHPANIAERLRLFMHCAFMRGKPDVGLDLLLPLKGACVVEPALDRLISTSSFTEMFNVDHRILDQCRIHVAPAHFH